MRNKTLMILAALGLLGLASCDDTSGSYPPTWKGFTYSPTDIYPGDSVLITAAQAKKGHYLNATDYSFSMKVRVDVDGETQDSTLSYSYHTNYDGTSNADPTWKLKIPDNTIGGTSYTCSFSAKWSNSADGNMGTYLGTSGGDGYTGSITSYSYTIYSQASGSFSLPIRIKQ
ncbi:MAG: hypothetical protein LUC44_06895 [Prevotellaceae bacterium]|nr:hypothetical protein [Prevotellaceae bacterium]